MLGSLSNETIAQLEQQASDLFSQDTRFPEWKVLKASFVKNDDYAPWPEKYEVCLMIRKGKNTAVVYYAVDLSVKQNPSLNSQATWRIFPNQPVGIDNSIKKAATILANKYLAELGYKNSRRFRVFVSDSNQNASVAFYSGKHDYVLYRVFVKELAEGIFVASGTREVTTNYRPEFYERYVPESIVFETCLDGEEKLLAENETDRNISRCPGWWSAQVVDDLALSGITTFDPSAFDNLRSKSCIQHLLDQAAQDDRKLILLPEYGSDSYHYPEKGTFRLTSLTIGLSLLPKELEKWVDIRDPFVNSYWLHKPVTLKVIRGAVPEILVDLVKLVQDRVMESGQHKLHTGMYHIGPPRSGLDLMRAIPSEIYQHVVYHSSHPQHSDQCMTLEVRAFADPLHSEVPVLYMHSPTQRRHQDLILVQPGNVFSPNQLKKGIGNIIKDHLTYNDLVMMRSHRTGDSFRAVRQIFGQKNDQLSQVMSLPNMPETDQELLEWLLDPQMPTMLRGQLLLIDSEVAIRLNQIAGQDIFELLSETHGKELKNVNVWRYRHYNHYWQEMCLPTY